MVNSFIASGLSFLGNLATSAINSSRSWKYAQKQMALQDQYNRAFTRDQYGLQRQGLEKAGYNPLLALGSSSNSAIYNGNGLNADSDNGSQAVTSGLDALRFKDEHGINVATKNKIEAETNRIKNENRKLEAEINTSPRRIFSEIVEGRKPKAFTFLKDNFTSLKDKSYTKLKDQLKNIGIILPDVTSSKSSQNLRIKLHDDKPYIQKGVPKEVIKKFSNGTSALSQKKRFETVSSWNNKNHKYYVEYLPDNYSGGKRKFDNLPKVPKVHIK